jgi:predicted nucleic acid-binding protein
MIAAVALRHGAALLAFDRDLTAIARVVDLPLDRASLSSGSTE